MVRRLRIEKRVACLNHFGQVLVAQVSQVFVQQDGKLISAQWLQPA
jgi:hypothetical protein